MTFFAKKNLNQRSLTPRWPLTPHLLRSHVWVYPRIIVSKSYENTSKYVDTVNLFAKTWTKSHWPLDDLWPHICWGHMCDSTQGSLCPSPMGIHQCMWIQWSILQVTTYIYIHILRTTYRLSDHIVSFWTTFMRDNKTHNLKIWKTTLPMHWLFCVGIHTKMVNLLLYQNERTTQKGTSMIFVYLLIILKCEKKNNVWLRLRRKKEKKKHFTGVTGPNFPLWQFFFLFFLNIFF